MAKIEQVDISYLYKNVVDERDQLKSFQANARHKLGSVKSKLSRADEVCQSLVAENDSLNQELGTLRQKFGDTQMCIEHFSREKEEIHADLRELKTLLAETEEGNAREKNKMTQEKVLMSMSLERMRHELSRIKAERDDARKSMATMEDVLHHRIQECDLLKKQKLELIQELGGKEKEIQQQVVSLTQGKEDLKKGFETAVQDNMQLKMDLEKAKIQCNSSESVNKTLAENKAKLKGEFDEVCVTFNNMKREYDMYRDEIQHKVDGLESDIAKKTSEVQRIQKEKNRAEAVMEDMKKTISKLEQEKEALSKEIEALREETQKEIVEKEAEIAQLIAYSKNKEKMLKQSDSLLTSKEQAMEKLKQEIEDYKSELSDVITEKNDLNERIEKRDEMIREWTTKCRKYETERQELETRYSNKLQDLMADFDSLRAECRRYTEENKELENVNSKLSSEIGSLKNSLKNLSNNAATMKSDIKDMKENKRKFEVECQILKEHNRNLHVKNEELAKTKDMMVQKNEELRIGQEETLSQLENLQTQHEHLSKVKEGVEGQVGKLMDEVESGQRMLVERERQHETEKDGIKNELDKAKRQLKATRDDVQLAEAKASKERLQQETEIVALKVKLTSKEQDFDKMSSKCITLEKDLEDEKKAREVEMKEREVEKVQHANLLAAVPEDMTLFRPVDGSTPLPTSAEPAPIKDVELGGEHQDIIEKLQNRWSDVIEERKEIKKAMMNFYRLIDILIDGKEKLEKDISVQKEKFEQKVHALGREVNGGFNRSDSEKREIADGLYGEPQPEDIQDPTIIEANLNNIFHETSLYEGHIQYLKKQIGAHYSKAEKALDKHKSTMKTITKLPDGKSLLPPTLQTVPSGSKSSLAESEYEGIMGEQGYKTLAEKHFQMINELSDLKKQVSTMKTEQQRLMMENQYLKGPDKVALTPSKSALMNTMPASLSSSFSGSSKVSRSPRREDFKLPMRSTVGDSRYREAIEVLKRELSC